MPAILLVDDDPLQAHNRKSVLERAFSNVERAADVADAFIRVEDPKFVASLGLVVVALSRPGLGENAFVAELTSRLPWVPILVLGRGPHDAGLYSSENVSFLPRSGPSEAIVAASRKLMRGHLARPA